MEERLSKMMEDICDTLLTIAERGVNYLSADTRFCRSDEQPQFCGFIQIMFLLAPVTSSTVTGWMTVQGVSSLWVSSAWRLGDQTLTGGVGG